MSFTNYEKCELLLPMRGNNDGTTFIDYSKNNFTVTPSGDAKTTTSIYKFYGSSGSFSGTGYLTVAYGPCLELMGSNFTIQFWIKTSTTQLYATPLARTNGAFTAGSWAFILNSGSANGYMNFWCSEYSNSGPLCVLNTNVCDDNWHKIRLTRDGSTWTLRADEVSSTTATTTVAIAPAPNATINIGADPYFGRYVVGNLQDIVIIRGAATNPGDTALTGVITNGSNAVLDDAGDPASSRTVIAVTRDATVCRSTQTDASGNYSIILPLTGSVYDVLLLDDAAGTQHADKIVSAVTPG